MNILIARNREECSSWTGVAVVVDVLRGATTACALLKRGKKDVLLSPDAQQADAFLAHQADFEAFSDVPLSASHLDNSPYLASKSAAHQPALLLAAAACGAVWHLRRASLVLLGGFCNFYALADMLTSQPQDVLLVPAAMFGPGNEEEDVLCAESLKDYVQGVGSPEIALAEFSNTMRMKEFHSRGPKTADKDSRLAFKVNGLPVVAQVTLAEDGELAVCHPYGSPAHWFETAHTRQEAASPAADQPVMDPMPQDSVPAERHAGKAKGFFSDLLRSVKEEKEELEESLLQGAAQTTASSSCVPSSEDPFDALMKRGAVSLSAAEEPANHAADTGREVESVALSKDRTFSIHPHSHAAVSPADEAQEPKKNKKAIVLFSGGLDSTTCLYWALAHGYECEALTVSYGQRHDREVLAAQMIARNLGVKLHLITLNLPWLVSSSLVDKNQSIPDVALENIPNEGIPSTYVPGRNLMFLSIAGSLLDSVGANAIIAGPNAIDFSGYPDCTPAFFKAAADALNRGTKMGVTEGIEVLAPLMRLSKTQIVQLAAKLKVPFELTWSCYAGGQKPCGHCDSCKLRAKGFAEAGVRDTSLD